MADLPKIVAELAEYARSQCPVKQAFLSLYLKGLIKPSGFRNGQIIWKELTND